MAAPGHRLYMSIPSTPVPFSNAQRVAVAANGRALAV